MVSSSFIPELGISSRKKKGELLPPGRFVKRRKRQEPNSLTQDAGDAIYPDYFGQDMPTNYFTITVKCANSSCDRVKTSESEWKGTLASPNGRRL